MSRPDAGTNWDAPVIQTHMSTGAVASPELLPDKVIGDDQVSEQVFPLELPGLKRVTAHLPALQAPRQ